MIFITSGRMVRDSGSNSAGGGGGEGATQQRFIRWSSAPEVQPLTCRKTSSGIYIYSYFEKGCRKNCTQEPRKVLSGFIWVHCSSKKFERMAGKGMDECLRVLRESVKRGSVKCRLRTDCGLLFLGLENNGTIVVTYSFAWWKTIVRSLRFTLTGFKSRFDSYSVDHIPYYLSGLSCAHFFRQPFSKLLYMIFSTCGGSNPGRGGGGDMLPHEIFPI